MGLLFAFCLAIGLGACAGLRAFVPLFMLGLFVRMGFPVAGAHPGEEALLLATDFGLLALGALALLECLVDAVPVVDTMMAVPNFAIRPLAGAAVAWIALSPSDPVFWWVALVCSVGIGLLVSLPVHTTSTTVRVVSTATTAGVANPVLSVKETALSTFGVVGFMLLAPLMLAMLALFAVVVFRWLRNKRASKQLALPAGTID